MKIIPIIIKTNSIISFVLKLVSLKIKKGKNLTNKIGKYMQIETILFNFLFLYHA